LVPVAFEDVSTHSSLRRVDVGQAAGRKIISESLSQHDEKNVVPTPLSGIRVGKKKNSVCESDPNISLFDKEMRNSLFHCTISSFPFIMVSWNSKSCR
jgi:hypothetical protein